MKKTVLLILAVTLGCAGLSAQTNTGKESFFHMSFVHPLDTHGSLAGEYTNTVSLNLLAGLSQNEKAFTLGGLANIIRRDAAGLQLAGVYNRVGNNGRGVLVSGLSNTVENDYTGFQLAGLTNRTRNSVTGMQLAGLLNDARNIKGVQLAGLGNIAGNVSGLQFGGLFNVARNVNGVQLAGLLNIAENSDYPIGIVNIIRNGEKSIGVSYNETGSTVASFRSGGRVLYGIIGIGFNHKSDDERYVTEAGLGAHINIAPRLKINNEIKGSFMTSFNDTYVNQYTFSILPAVRIGSSFEIFAGPGISYIESDNLRNGRLFPGNSLWNKHDEDKLRQLHIGYTAGVQFVF